MSENMSQDEINALLGLTGDSPPKEEEILDPLANMEQFMEASAAAETPASPLAAAEPPEAPNATIEQPLTAEEVDLLGEVGNMCMGAVATTMYTLLNHRVSITTPRVGVFSPDEVLNEYQTPFVVVDVEYIEGIDGKNLLMLKEYDAMLITDLLMGGDGHVEEGSTLNELHMSAISEVMNQMIGASATAMSKILGRAVNISPPKSDYVEINAGIKDRLDASEMVVKISFDMEIDSLLNSQLLQLMPFTLARDLAAKLLYQEEESATTTAPAPSAAPPPPPPPAAAPSAAPPPSPVPTPAPEPYAYPPQQPVPPAPDPHGYPPQQPYGYPPQQPYGYPPPPYGFQQPPSVPQPSKLVDVRPANYPAFDEQGHMVNGGRKSLSLVSDIPLQVSVELGKAKKTINEILEFGIGTIVVLEKMAGEHVEVLVNGKLVASGEVVVIDENYGVRITDIYD